MRKISKKTAFQVTAVGGISLLAAAAIAPGAVAAGTVDGDVNVSNTETVQVLMDASGKIDSQRVYEQLVLTGKGKVDIANPVSTKGLRNLDGFGGYDVRDGKVRVKSDVDGTKKFRSVSDFTKKLPLDVSVGYVLDGKKVKPGDVVGKNGDLEVRYRVTNNTGVNQDVAFKDGKGNDKTAPESVVIPMVGSLTTTLPSNFTKVQSAEANAAGDGRGGTTLSFTMTLIPPIGKNYADFGYTAHVKDGVIPKANISALPVNPLESPSFKGGAESYKGGAETGADLTEGATEIDANVLKLRDGASDLVAGLLQLQDGAGQLNSGAGELAAGTGRLNKGANDLSAGSGKIENGADKLNDGLNEASSKAPGLLTGADKLIAGAKKVDAGLVKLNSEVAAGATTFQNTFDGLVDLRTQSMSDGLGGIIAAYLNPAITDITNNANLTSAEKTSLLTQIGTAKGGLQQVQGQVTGSVRTELKTGVAGGLAQLTGGVSGGVGSPAAPDTLRNGMAQLIGGLGQLKTEGGKLVDGLDELSDGAGKLEVGTDSLSSGAGQLASGSGELNSGAGKLAAGSGLLADGLNQAAEAAPALPEGADRLSKEGTKELIKAGDETASDYGLKYALIAAGAERAASAQPYGSPEGATELSAYKFELASANGAGSANTKRGLAAAVLLAGTAGIAAIRRKGLI